jgi:hypothetical protein
VWALTAVMVGVLIYELVVNAREQGSPISLKVRLASSSGEGADSELNPACRESNVGTVLDGINQPRCTVPSLHEVSHRSTSLSEFAL